MKKHLNDNQEQESPNNKRQKQEESAIEAENFFQLGMDYFESEDYEEAVDALTRATELAPTNAAYFYELGLAYKNIDKYGNAIEFFIKAIELGSTDPDCFYQLGDAYLQVGNKREGLKLLNEALNLDPTNEVLRMHSSEYSMCKMEGETPSEQYKRIKDALLNFAKLGYTGSNKRDVDGGHGYSSIIDFCIDGWQALDLLPNLASQQNDGIKKAALPALRMMVSKTLESEDYLDALAAFDMIIKIEKPTDPEMFVAAETTARKILEVQYTNINYLFKISCWAKNVKLTGEGDEEKIKDLFKNKMHEYHAEAKSLLPKEALLEWHGTNHIHDGVFDILLSYIVPGETLKSIKPSDASPSEFNVSVPMANEEASLAGEIAES